MDALGYEVRPQSGLRRRFVEAATNETLNAVVATVAMPLDRFVYRGTGGRWSATAILAGFPLLWLTTTGAKSRQPREVPLLGIPTPSRNLAVIGTDFGRERTPGWVHNLLAHPEVIAKWRHSTANVTAIRLEPEAQEPVWEEAIAAYPNYGIYRDKVAHRSIHVFELDPNG